MFRFRIIKTAARASAPPSRILLGPYYQITLDRVLKAGFDYLAGNPNANGAGFVLLNNIIRNNREHGMLLFGDNGIVEGNLIDGSTVEGIGIGPSF